MGVQGFLQEGQGVEAIIGCSFEWVGWKVSRNRPWKKRNMTGCSLSTKIKRREHGKGGRRKYAE